MNTETPDTEEETESTDQIDPSAKSGDQKQGVPLDEMEPSVPSGPEDEDPNRARSASELEAVFDVPVKVAAILGRARMQVRELLSLGPGTVLELDRKVGEAIDIYVNNRLVARGEVVLVEDKLGVTMTEIIKSDK
jgi:flagellar motor switch protein FliN/FliY